MRKLAELAASSRDGFFVSLFLAHFSTLATGDGKQMCLKSV